MEASVPPVTGIDLDLAARGQTSVLITAANDRLRELCARSIHEAGTRPDGPFRVLRYADGAQPSSTRPGVRALDAALAGTSGGTLFVDNVGEMGTEAQQRLLAATASAQVRIIAGSGRSLVPDVTAGRFDPRLFYRLNVVHLTPALQD